MSENQKRLVVYACGGTGARVVTPGVVKAIQNLGGQVVFVDASADPQVQKSSGGEFFHIRNSRNEVMDGGGAQRRSIAADVARNIPDIIEKHHPGHYNITVGSGGGASGSTIAPLMVRELLNQGHAVVSLFSTSEEAKQQLKNGIAVLETYQAISESLKVNVPVMHWHADKQDFEAINNKMRIALVMLGILFLKATFDSADMRNFFTPEELKDHTGVKMLETYMSILKPGADQPTVELADGLPEYALSRLCIHREKVIPKNMSAVTTKFTIMDEPGDLERLLGAPPAIIDYVTSEESIGLAYERLDSTLSQMIRVQESRGAGIRPVKSVDADDTGLVF